ncbi:hypothetical protein [Aquimarina agarilytica]|uniref:hypothetical protein n=1 Tax=Aquimarina agarilytica TaxID=1087449 RepID=UPI00028A18E1|nr:hypothetical protein [Aquimarina agarilytica]
MKNLLLFVAFTVLGASSIVAQTTTPKKADKSHSATPEAVSYTETDFEEMKSNYLKNPIFVETINKRVEKKEKSASILKEMLTMNFEQAKAKFGLKEVTSAIFAYQYSKKSLEIKNNDIHVE